MEVVNPAVEILFWIWVGMVGIDFSIGIIATTIALCGKPYIAEKILIWVYSLLLLLCFFGFIVIILAFTLR